MMTTWRSWIEKLLNPPLKPQPDALAADVDVAIPSTENKCDPPSVIEVAASIKKLWNDHSPHI